MYLHLRQQKSLLILLAIIAALTALSVSCQKELNGELNNVIPGPPNLTTMVSTSVSGFVTDENDGVVKNASVTVGTGSTVTDKYGFFEIKNVQVIQEAAVIVVTRSGYFKGIKTFIAANGKDAFFRIKLIPKTNVGNVDAAIGGSVTLPTGLIISLPGNTVVNAATNAAYSGQVNIAAKWIDPTSNDLSSIMPGDLRGLDTLGSIKLLTTFGMAAVELTGSSGELLQIASGKKATLTIPLPAAISVGAPSSIPLWYFNETTGLWVEQGNAIKSGNNYVGEVSHFSFWNCDIPNDYVRFSCTIVNAKGVPLKNVLVKVSVVSDPLSAGYGYTDSAGYTGGAVPGNAQLLLQVFSDYGCTTALYAQNFTTVRSNIGLGNIKVTSANIASVTGLVADCNNVAVTNGFVIMVKDGISYHHRVNNLGAFSFTTPLCSSNAGVTFVAEDSKALQSGNPFIATLIAGNNAIGSLNACGTAIQQYINYSINGISYAITAPADSLTQSFSGPTSFITIMGSSTGSVNYNYASIYLNQQGIAVNSTQPLISFITNKITDSTRILTPINITITEYGAVGQFMAGNFTGMLNGPAPVNTPYNIICSFRVRRMR